MQFIDLILMVWLPTQPRSLSYDLRVHDEMRQLSRWVLQSIRSLAKERGGEGGTPSSDDEPQKSAVE